MSEMVERIARAMFGILIANDGPYALAQGDDPMNVTLDGSFDLTTLARAGIEAMREPTTKMLSAGMKSRANTGLPGLRPKNEWEAMIDAALGE